MEATNKVELDAWGKKSLETSNQADARKLSTFLQWTQKRGQLRGRFLYFDSARQIEQIKPYPFSWEVVDPMQEDVTWNTGYAPLKGRFSDTIHSLHRKARSHREDISARAIEMQIGGHKEMPLDFGNPLDRFEVAFARLLPGKRMEKLNNKQSNTIMYRTQEGVTLPLATLSSGEREVVSIVFDFLLRDPKDCIIVFDEPELHLHPELAYRLLRTLRDVGERNQFVLSTHSPDIISASLDQSVVFVAPPRSGVDNQAVQLRENDAASDVLRLIGQSIGVISLGRKIVLIEGSGASLDKQVYGSIIGPSHPEMVLVPVGGKETILSFAKSLDTVLSKTVWGVEFFMLCDGDSLLGASAPSGGRLQRLPRYHVENYFLDEGVIASVFAASGEADGSWLLDPVQVRAALRGIAGSLVGYAAALRVSNELRLAAGNVDMMPSECHAADADALEALFEERPASSRTLPSPPRPPPRPRAWQGRDRDRAG